MEEMKRREVKDKKDGDEAHKEERRSREMRTESEERIENPQYRR